MTIVPPPLYMMQLAPDASRAARWMEENKLVRLGHDDGYGWHALLTACFGDLAPKPFRVIERGGRPLQLLAYTTQTIASLRERADTYAEPAAMVALGADELTAKKMPSEFRAGQHLGFEVRVRPMVRQDRDGDRKRSREIDAFLSAVQKAGPRGERDEIEREWVYRDWLAARMGMAATLEPGSVKIENLRRAMLLRRRQPPSRGSIGAGHRELLPVGLLQKGASGQQGGSPDAVFTGTLLVASPAEFMALLARGIGRHRAFGYGMLLLRPPRRG